MIVRRADVTQEQSLTDAFEEAKKALGTIDGCVTAAGISLDKPFEKQTWAEVARVHDINVSFQSRM
jgi:sorbose reductase